MFEEIFNQYSWEKARERIYNSTAEDVRSALCKERKRVDDLYALFSPAADGFIEELALLSQSITRARFGNTMQLYAPLYISNECGNACAYCGFNRNNKITRLTLTDQSVIEESEILYNMGFKHLLLVSGEDRNALPPLNLSRIIKNIHKKIASVSIEIYPMDDQEYKLMEQSGADGLTVYQETYNRETYNEVHSAGKKQDFSWRLHAPDRGGSAGFRRIGIGALLGLSDWRVDGFFCALHANYLMKKYWTSLIQISFPRLRKASGNFTPPNPVNDRELTHLICAMRIIYPDAGLLLSTRESAYLRDNLMLLGITTMSAGSRTEPGGYSCPQSAGEQFEIDDSRPPEIIADVIRQKGLDPVWKDWDCKFLN